MVVTPSRIIFGAAFIAYPVLIYLGLAYLDARSVAVFLVLLAMARVVFARRSGGRDAFTPQLVFALAAVAGIGFLAILSNSPDYLLFYPACMNGLMLVLFSVSLLRPPTVVERLARVQNPDLPDAAIGYTRKVTVVWCVFFVLNGSAALYTALNTSLEVWTIYNGSIAYALMGVLFVGEYLVRRRVQNRVAV